MPKQAAGANHKPLRLEQEGKMHLSVFSDELGTDIKEAAAAIKSWGSEYIDLRGMINGKNIEYQTDAELTELKMFLDDMGLAVGALQTSLCKVNLPDMPRQKEELKKLEGIIRAADALDCRLIRCFNYWQHKNEDPLYGTLKDRPQDLSLITQMMAPITARAKEAGLMLSFENCGQTPDEVIAVLDALSNPEWGMAWDVTNHVNILADDSDTEREFAKCIDRATMLHAKSWGIVDEVLIKKAPWERITDLVRKSGKDLPVCVETHNPKGSPLTDEAATKICFDYLYPMIYENTEG
jgi:sugar phosphate isomerase/epimerase